MYVSSHQTKLRNLAWKNITLHGLKPCSASLDTSGCASIGGQYDVEGIIATMHEMVGEAFDVKQFTDEQPKILNEFNKRINPDLSFFYWTSFFTAIPLQGQESREFSSKSWNVSPHG